MARVQGAVHPAGTPETASPPGWPVVPLGDYASLTKGLSYKSTFLNEDGPDLIGLGQFVPGGGAKLEGGRTYAGEYRERDVARPGDILIAMTDLTQRGDVLGSPLMVPRSVGDFCLYTLDAGKLDPDASVDARFLYYMLKSRDFRAFAAAHATGTTVRRVRPVDVLAYEFVLPPLEEQRAIARVLGALDDKIELNRRMSETLEEMARALFRSWFVDFDPVRAKAKGRPSGLPPDLDALFPASFEASELGEIPAGWEVRTLGDVVDISSGRRPKQRHPRPAVTANVPVFGGAGAMAYTADALYASPVIITGRVGTLGVVHRVSFPVWPSDNTLVIIPRSGPEFVWLLGVVSKINLSNLNRGSTQPLITQRDLKAQTIVVPPKSVLLHFADLTDPLYASSDSTSDLSGTMADLRDALLPRLVSGELRVIRRDRGHY